MARRARYAFRGAALGAHSGEESVEGRARSLPLQGPPNLDNQAGEKHDDVTLGSRGHHGSYVSA